LPAELRNRIYHDILCQGRIIVHFRNQETHKIAPKVALTRTITQVCRQIRQESLPVYLHNNTFVIQSHRVRRPAYSNQAYSVTYLNTDATTIPALTHWLQERVPMDFRNFLHEVALPRPLFGGPSMWFGSLYRQLFLIAEYMFSDIDRLVPLAIMTRPIRRGASWISEAQFDLILMGVARLAAQVKEKAREGISDDHGVATGFYARVHAFSSWVLSLSSIDQTLISGEPFLFKTR